MPTPPAAAPPALPHWPARTIATLATVPFSFRRSPYLTPVPAPVRADDHAILLALSRGEHSGGEALAMLRDDPNVAVQILATGDIAFTARGIARVVAQHLPVDSSHCAVLVEVTALDDHRHPAYTIETGPDRSWIDLTEKHTADDRTAVLQQLVQIRARKLAGMRPPKERPLVRRGAA